MHLCILLAGLGSSKEVRVLGDKLTLSVIMYSTTAAAAAAAAAATTTTTTTTTTIVTIVVTVFVPSDRGQYSVLFHSL
jgi:hypothetical protein